MQLPLLNLASMEKYLSKILLEAGVEGHHTYWVRLHVGDVASACVLQGCLSWYYQIRVVSAQYARKDQEQEQENHEHHVDRLNVISTTSLNVVCTVRVIDISLCVAVPSKRQSNYFWQSLREQKQPESTMVQLSNIATDSEAMMVKFPDTSITLPTVTTSIRLHNLACVAETFLRHSYLFD